MFNSEHKNNNDMLYLLWVILNKLITKVIIFMLYIYSKYPFLLFTNLWGVVTIKGPKVVIHVTLHCTIFTLTNKFMYYIYVNYIIFVQSCLFVNDFTPLLISLIQMWVVVA